METDEIKKRAGTEWVNRDPLQVEMMLLLAEVRDLLKRK